ncbi:nuclear transport factor 2 family protein [Chroococcidiopsis sp. CCMEE 29]|jgi:phenylpyruvate tautomerase PptA (4-oxalocrotonate tautomerase family)/ketosteroid isomerase-like protein|uniref:nuclear transport factor 2 family protein n=1 Tax=Chroococcidiopsis sp. CCMEE 29 TaxID=155894 RepID=UPI0020216260|nr:nuclear transport factor 2 family protein [Chroococcidiopsis sp. CCMEE 29]
MPIIRVTLLEDFASSQQKSEIVQELSNTLANVMGEIVRPYTYALVDEVSSGAWSIQGGALMTEEMMRAGIGTSNQQRALRLTEQRVRQAYDVLASGDRQRIEEYWDKDMTWLVPGHNQISGLKRGLDEFLSFMDKVGFLTDNSFQMSWDRVLITGDTSVDIRHNTGHRAGDETRRLDIDVVHVLRWHEGKVIEGRGAIFGDGTAQFDEFWR